MENIVINTKDDMLSALNEYYESYVLDTFNGAFQVFQSFTYGEMVISLLLFSMLILFVLKWVYEVIR